MESIIDDVETLSEALLPPALGPDERVVFKLCNVGKKEHGREEPSCPEVWQLTAKERVIDPFHKKDKTSKAIPTPKTISTYVTENKFIGGRMQAVYAAPRFIKGYIAIGADEQGMYTRLMRSRHNKSNKFRKQMAGGGLKCKDIFELVHDVKEITEQLYLDDLRYQAETIVRNADQTALFAIAENLNKSLDARTTSKHYRSGDGTNIQRMIAIKHELIQIAKLYPKQLVAASDDDKAKLQVHIYDSLNFGVLIWNGENRAYWLTGTGTADNIDKIHTPSPDKDKNESLMEYLMSDAGEKHYTLMVNLLMKALGIKS